MTRSWVARCSPCALEFSRSNQANFRKNFAMHGDGFKKKNTKDEKERVTFYLGE